MKITTSKSLPPSSSLYLVTTQFHYIDSFKAEINHNSNLSANKISDLFIKSITKKPKWMKLLINIRNYTVGIFGIKKTTDFQEEKEPSEIKIGENMGMFKLFDKLENEVVLGKNDKHLNFRLSILSEKSIKNIYTLNISTLVKFNNFFGRFYFSFIKIFHKVIVKSMLRKMVNEV